MASSENIIWQKTRQAAIPAENELHLWLIRFRPDKETISVLNTLLAQEEKERAKGYHFTKDRERFIFARGHLRILLGRYLGIAPAEVKFLFNEYKKPSVQAIDRNRAIQFNVAHSADLSLVGVTFRQEIGVDVEYVNPDFSFDEILRQFFSGQEAARINAQPEVQRRETFYRLWTLKEAYLKALGIGLSQSLSLTQNLFIKNEHLIFPGEDREQKSGYRWFARQFYPQEQYVATVVVRGELHNVKYLEWNNVVEPYRSE